MTDSEFIDLVKEHKSFEVAFSIKAREDNKNWLCPCCYSVVKPNGQARYETGIEHVTDPNREEYPLRDKYQCTNEECITKRSDIFWDYYGDRYGSIKIDGKRVYDDDKYFVDSNDSPFGSDSRSRNVEIYKKGLKDKTFLHPALCLWFLQPMIEHTYVADNDGFVLKKGYKLLFLKRVDGMSGYCCHFSTCWSTWSYLFRKNKRHLKNYKETQNPDCLVEMFSPAYNRAWVYKWFEGFAKIYWFKYYIIQK
jgi:hypothetical protein